MRYQLIIPLLAKPYLLQGSLLDKGLALLTKVVGFLPDPEADQKEMKRVEDPNDWTTSLSPLPRFSDWEYQKILQMGVLPLAKREPFTITRILIDATASMIRLRMHSEQIDKSGGEDASEIWCSRLDEPDQGMRGSVVALVNSLTEACSYVFESAPESIDAMDQILRNQRWGLFKRLRQHLYAIHLTEQTLPWIREFIIAHKDYGQWEHHHEFQKMIRAASEHFGSRLLTEAECSDVCNAILGGPCQDEFRKWMGDRYSDEEWNIRKRFFHRKQLHPFAKLLFGTYRTYYEDLEREFETDKLNDEDYSVIGKARSGFISFQSPRSRDELVKLNDVSLLSLINEWQESGRDSNNWLVEINISALAGVFQNVFKDLIISNHERFTFWIANRERIERPIYVKAMLAGMRELTKEKRFEHLGDWLAFADWVLERPNKAGEDEGQRSSDESRVYPSWHSCRREVGDLLNTCLDKEVQVPLSVRAALTGLLRKLCTQFDYPLDHERPVLLNRDSQVTEAINNTRSRALESLVNFGYWLRRHKVEGHFIEMREIIGARIADDASIPLSLPESAILGLNFVQIWNIDKDWSQANKSRLFPQARLIVWAEAFKAFITFSHPFLPIFEVLKEDFGFALQHLIKFDEASSTGRNTIESLGQHLFTYFLWEVYPLHGADSLLSAFYDKTNGNREYWAHLFSHVGRTLRNTTPKLNPKLLERILAFFEWRLQQAEPTELKEFTFWLEAPCLDAEWRLDSFGKVIDIAPSDDVNLSIELDAMNELLQSHSAKVVECLAKITDRMSSEQYVYFPKEKTMPILLAGLRSTDADVIENAERAQENLLKAHRFEFLDLK